MDMAGSLEDEQFWLPPYFLADDDDTLDQNSCATKKGQNCVGSSPLQSGRPSFPFEFGTFSGFSDFSSPGESLKGSNETQRKEEEEDCIVGLTLHMARSTVDDGRGLPVSPQSTLCDMGSGSGCSQVSSRGSPKCNCEVQLQSPPATWDLLHAAAEEVARMGMNEGHGVLQTSKVCVPVKNSTNGTGFYQKLHGLQPLQRNEIMQPQNLTAGEQVNFPSGYQRQHIHQMVPNGVQGRKGLSSSACLPPPQGFGMATSFHGTQGGKRESAGTGVFLPRHSITRSEQGRKPVCSTVLVPAKVMKALNLKLDDICNQPHLQPVACGRFNSENDVLLRLQINRGGNYKKRYIRRQ